MQIAALPTSVRRAANSRPTPEISPEAANRLTLIEQWDAMRGEGITAAKAADILRVPRANLYRWKSRLRKRGLRGLEPDSRRPRNVRRLQREPALVKAVLAQRTAPPWFGKDKIAVLLRKKGWKVSASTVGRIIAEAKRRGVLREPPRPGVARRKPRPPQASPQAPLRRPQAECLPANPPRRPRPDRHARCPPLARRDPQAFHRAGRRLPLRCPASGNAGDLLERRAVLGGRRGAHALPRQSDTGGRGLRVSGGVRGCLQGAGHPAVRASAAFAEVERACGAGAQDACRGVLQLLRRGVDDGAVEPRVAGVGGVLQRGAPASVAWLVESDGVSCGASPEDGLLNPRAVSYVWGEYSGLTRRRRGRNLSENGYR